MVVDIRLARKAESAKRNIFFIFITIKEKANGNGNKNKNKQRNHIVMGHGCVKWTIK